VDRGTKVWWGLFGALTAASCFFAVGASRRRESLAAQSATVATGELVALVAVVDADSVVVRNPAGEDVAVRLVGIKALEVAQSKDPLAYQVEGARRALERMLEERAIRVLVHSPPKDRHGRMLATLFVDDEDVGLRLVREGHVIVYTPFPFSAMQRYLDEQARARADRRGLWGDAETSARADALTQVWRREAP
jgi:micrococcal nuclease